MSKGNGMWKVVLAGAVISVAVSGGMYLTVPKPVDIETGLNKASGESFDRSLYGIPDVNMGHYKLDEDSYFKYKVDGTLDISRLNPSSVPDWLTDFEIWNNEEAFADEKVAFNEKRMKILTTVGDVDAASSVEDSLKDPDVEENNEEESSEGAEAGSDEGTGDSTGDGETVDENTGNYVGDDENVTDVGTGDTKSENGDDAVKVDSDKGENGGSENE